MASSPRSTCEHFEVDEHGNWASGDSDAEREAAWSEYYGDEAGPPGADEQAETPKADDSTTE